MTNIENNADFLTDIEKDVLGEVMNISMGSAATAMSTILDKKVNITTPRIETIMIDEFEFSYLEPVIGVLINYIEGIEGSNILLLRETDLSEILRHLLSMEPEDTLEFDEISRSAVCEIMNQMMGSAASALASFLDKPINISPPEIMDTANKEAVKNLFKGENGRLINIKFNLSIEGLVESEFISAMEPALARGIVKMSLGASDTGEDDFAYEQPVPQQEATMPEMPPMPETPNVPQYDNSQMMQPPPDMPQPQPQPMQQPYVAPMQQPYAAPMQQAVGDAFSQPQAAVYQAPVEVAPYTYKPLSGTSEYNSENDKSIHGNNLDLIMSVPIQITVELGKTKKKIKDIAELTLGNIVELDRQAGDRVDVVANGRLIARGDVVVVGDNYSVRITEIVKGKNGLPEIK
ncbi:MAG: flagellar motor switch phosphatase FliY [Eubacteriales bacterium]|nr:flagellar motor switch phosphatase FliY [Eubacteriales bacterium]